jgi:hypothetical protein
MNVRTNPPSSRGARHTVAGLLNGVLLLGAACVAAEPDRTVLPIREPDRPVYTELDARNVKVPPAFSVKAPTGAPNVVIVLVDDLGFGATSTFGGPIPTPTLRRTRRRRACVTRTSTPRRCARRRARR